MIDESIVWDRYRWGYGLADLLRLFPGSTPAQLRRAILGAAASQRHSVPPAHMIPCGACGAPTCGAAGMRIVAGAFRCPDCVTLDWIPWEEAA